LHNVRSAAHLPNDVPDLRSRRDFLRATLSERVLDGSRENHQVHLLQSAPVGFDPFCRGWNVESGAEHGGLI
jgi:hypothetical protein